MDVSLKWEENELWIILYNKDVKEKKKIKKSDERFKNFHL